MNKNCEYTNGGGIKNIEIEKEFECSRCGNTFKRYVPIFNTKGNEYCDSCKKSSGIEKNVSIIDIKRMGGISFIYCEDILGEDVAIYIRRDVIGVEDYELICVDRKVNRINIEGYWFKARDGYDFFFVEKIIKGGE